MQHRNTQTHIGGNQRSGRHNLPHQECNWYWSLYPVQVPRNCCQSARCQLVFNWNVFVCFFCKALNVHALLKLLQLGLIEWVLLGQELKPKLLTKSCILKVRLGAFIQCILKKLRITATKVRPLHSL